MFFLENLEGCKDAFWVHLNRVSAIWPHDALPKTPKLEKHYILKPRHP